MSAIVQLIPPTQFAKGRPSGRFSFAFGRRFYLLLFIGLIWIGPGWADPRYLYAILAWDACVLLLWLLDYRRLPRPEQVAVSRIWSAPLQLSGTSVVALEVRSSAQTSLSLQLTDHVPAAMRAESPEMEMAVTRGEKARAEYSVLPRERGDIRLGNVTLRYQSPWRIAERWATVALPQTVRIYPNLEESKRDTIFLIRSRQIALEKRHKHLPGQGREFESLREYRETDEWRDICWSATARRGKIISKSYQVERSQTVWLVLDAGRLLRTRVRGLSKLDYAVNAALSLAQVALYSGDRVAMLAYGRRVQQRLPAGRGSAHVRALMEGLSQVRGEELEADHARAAQALYTFQKRRSLVVWLTDLSETATTPEVIECASRIAHRHLVLFTVIGQPELRELLAERPETDREMFHYVAAQEIVLRRDLLLRTLRKQGALTLEVEPSKLSSAIVNQYLMAKERSLI
ncbi:MAG TPA: DUF58 domain-containing protein [Candidatus Saccharimonadales bacterium]|nr:DUF58 domain-containing protein [Candidatus Saccharimonadales bacterium]